MIYIFVFVICLVMVACYMHLRIKYNSKVNKIFVQDVIPLEHIILFSHDECAKHMLSRFKNNKKDIWIDFLKDGCYVVFEATDSREKIITKFSIMQNKILKNKDKCIIENEAYNYIFSAWLDYGHSRAYRKIFNSQVLNKDIIDSSFWGEVYKYFFELDVI